MVEFPVTSVLCFFFFKFVFILYLKNVLTWKIVKVSKASVLYIYRLLFWVGLKIHEK